MLINGKVKHRVSTNHNYKSNWQNNRNHEHQNNNHGHEVGEQSREKAQALSLQKQTLPIQVPQLWSKRVHGLRLSFKTHGGRCHSHNLIQRSMG